MVSTRSSNSETRPGLVDAPRPRRSHAQSEADKKAKQAAVDKKKADRSKKERGLAAMEVEMQTAQEKIRERRVINSRADVPHPANRTILSNDKAAKEGDGTKKRKRDGKVSKGKGKQKQVRVGAEASELDSDGGAREASEAPTPAPDLGTSSSLSELESDSDNGPAVEETPRPPKKAKVSKPKVTLREQVELAKTTLARSESNADVEMTQHQAPDSALTSTHEVRYVLSSRPL